MNKTFTKSFLYSRKIYGRSIFLILLILVSISACSTSNSASNTIDNPDIGDDVVNNNSEDNNYSDMLTPSYYNSDNNNSFRVETDNFLGQVRKEEFHHPLENILGQIPSFTVPVHGEFGAPKGTFQHHTAVDLHIEDNETEVILYASYDGFVRTVKDAAKYRHYLSITKEIRNSSNQIIGKLVTLYAHIDLDLDEAESLVLDGQFVSKGEIVSKHLYSDTVGGPHLHFEIRYYRPSDIGDEEFYGSKTAERSEPSSGEWLYGYWNPDIGFGYGNSKNHGLKLE